MYRLQMLLSLFFMHLTWKYSVADFGGSESEILYISKSNLWECFVDTIWKLFLMPCFCRQLVVVWSRLSCRAGLGYWATPLSLVFSISFFFSLCSLSHCIFLVIHAAHYCVPISRHFMEKLVSTTSTLSLPGLAFLLLSFHLSSCHNFIFQTSFYDCSLPPFRPFRQLLRFAVCLAFMEPFNRCLLKSAL